MVLTLPERLQREVRCRLDLHLYLLASIGKNTANGYLSCTWYTGSYISFITFDLFS